METEVYATFFLVTLHRSEDWHLRLTSPFAQILPAEDWARPSPGVSLSTQEWLTCPFSQKGEEMSKALLLKTKPQKPRICNTTLGSSLGLQSRKQNRTIFQVLLCYCLCNVLKNIFQMIHLQSNKNNGCCRSNERSWGELVSNFILWRGSGTGVWSHLLKVSGSVPGAFAAPGGAAGTAVSLIIEPPGYTPGWTWERATHGGGC